MKLCLILVKILLNLNLNLVNYNLQSYFYYEHAELVSELIVKIYKFANEVTTTGNLERCRIYDTCFALNYIHLTIATAVRNGKRLK